ncbi:MAG: right-handed parallel beta-helix repeat-containing protein [Fimbriimonadaceae bacterium]|nr:right-handed parallel beta-helix repeat-containing protein [Fimbriimonadaceae bacterium]
MRLRVDWTEGADERPLQAAVDQVGAAGGGAVELSAGRWLLHDSLHLRSGVTVRGCGADTVLAKAPMVSSPVACYLGYGHTDVSVQHPERFRVGWGVYVADDRAPGFYGTVSRVTWIDGDRLGLGHFLNHDYHPDQHAVVKTIYPVVNAAGVIGATLADLAVDGESACNDELTGCRGGGVFLLQTRDVTLRGLHVRDYAGDAISFQQTRDTLVEDCLLERNRGHGLHPGSGSVRPVMRRVVARQNGRDGLFYCLRVTWSLTELCQFEDNAGVGISIGGRDTDHWIRRNQVRGNGRHGVWFRPGDAAIAAHRCLLEENQIEANGRAGVAGEVLVEGPVEQVHLVRNQIVAVERPELPAQPLLLRPEVRQVVLRDNALDPVLEAAVAAHPALQTGHPAPPPVGPGAAPPDCDRHLLPLP